MGDCRSLNYGYYFKFEEETIYLKCEHGADIALTDDIDMSNPTKGLLRYAVISPWSKFAGHLIRKAISQRLKEKIV